MEEYLRELVSQMSSRDAAEAIGYSRRSDDSLRNLCRLYGVEIPHRHNQYTVPLTPLTQPPVTSQRVLRPAAREKVGVEKCLVVSDLHVPFHDERSVSVALAIAEDIKPEVVVFNGDLVDFYAISRFAKDPHRALMLQQEIDAAKDILHRFRKACPKARMVYVEGNHEARLRNYLISRAPELAGLAVLDLRHLLDLDALRVAYVPSRGRSAYWRYGVVTIGHFDIARVKSGYTETALIEKRHESVVQGHTHRVADITKTLPDGRVIGGIGSGCLCDLDPEYCTDPDWCQAVVVITKRIDTDRFHTDLVKIIDHEALYEGVLYSG